MEWDVEGLVHVIATSSPEVQDLRGFRDRVRADPSMRAADVAPERAILADGCTDPTEYCNRKGESMLAFSGNSGRPAS